VILILNKEHATGIKNANTILAKRLEDTVDVELTTVSRANAWQVLMHRAPVIFSFHFIHLIFIRWVLFRKRRDVFFCHGAVEWRDYSLVKFSVLKAIYACAHKLSAAVLYVSENTRHRVAVRAKQSYIIRNVDRASRTYQVHLKDEPDFVYFGRLHQAKNIPAIAELAEMYGARFGYQPKIYIWGPGDLTIVDKVKAKTGLQVIYKGTFSDLQEIAVECNGNIFFSGNENEPFGIAYLDALELNMVPILPEKAGASEVLEGGVLKYASLDALKTQIRSCQMQKNTTIHLTNTDDIEKLKRLFSGT
jgi:glycosyltransferase involved in cell wall biosynthesis